MDAQDGTIENLVDRCTKLVKENRELKSEIEKLKNGMVDLTFELSDQDHMIAARDDQIAMLIKKTPPAMNTQARKRKFEKTSE